MRVGLSCSLGLLVISDAPFDKMRISLREPGVLGVHKKASADPFRSYRAAEDAMISKGLNEELARTSF